MFISQPEVLKPDNPETPLHPQTPSFLGAGASQDGAAAAAWPPAFASAASSTEKQDR